MYIIHSVSCSTPAKIKSHLPREISFKNVQEKKAVIYTEDHVYWHASLRQNKRFKRNSAEMFPLLFLRQKLWMLGGNEGYGLQKIARLTISLNGTFFCHHERQNIGLDAPLAWPHRIFLKNLSIMHDYTSVTYKNIQKSVWETTSNFLQSILAITKLSLDYPLCNRKQQLWHQISSILIICNLFSYSTASKLAAWLHKHIKLQGLFDQLCLQAIKLHECTWNKIKDNMSRENLNLTHAESLLFSKHLFPTAPI